MHSFPDLGAKVPTVICVSLRASMYRFARSEYASLCAVAEEAAEFWETIFCFE